jgi:hypothetical protein
MHGRIRAWRGRSRRRDRAGDGRHPAKPGRRTLHRRRAGGEASLAEAATFRVLDAIEAAGDAGRVMTVTGVADALGVDQPRASRLVARAVRAGLVRRGADPATGGAASSR